MSNTENQMVDTGQGVLVGVQPAQPRAAGDWQGNTRPDQAVSQPVVVVQPGGNGQQPMARWTDEDIARARQEEKDKLYGRIEEMGAQLKELSEARTAELAEREAAAAAAADALRIKEEDELGVRELLAKRETEFQAQITALEKRYDADRAVFEQERRLQEIETYRRERIEQEAEFILPELRDLISGITPEAVDASIEVMKARTEQIFANMQAAQPQPYQYQPVRGAAPTAPPVGPMEQLPAYESLTPEDIKGMDMETYKKYRPQLLQATRPRPQR